MVYKCIFFYPFSPHFILQMLKEAKIENIILKKLRYNSTSSGSVYLDVALRVQFTFHHTRAVAHYTLNYSGSKPQSSSFDPTHIFTLLLDV